ncbi:hypothetical protein G6L37_00800 [Agrobacterium rubi]|nr:hypothetical protein [Agrobacterium rubi]NTF23929.1 hypothetical protein [Agrobacterium rubi]
MKTIAALYENFSDGSAAVAALEARGLDADHVSILSNTRDGVIDTGSTDVAKAGEAGAGIGAALGGAGGLLTGLGFMAIPGVGPVVAAGWLAALGLGAAVGAAAGVAVGGLIGVLTNSGISDEDAELYAEAVKRGATLVTAKVSEERVNETQAILIAAGSINPVLLRESYSNGGWTKFDPANAVDLDEAERLRRRTAA